jgi:hypothetical protein
VTNNSIIFNFRCEEVASFANAASSSSKIDNSIITVDINDQIGQQSLKALNSDTDDHLVSSGSSSIMKK